MLEYYAIPSFICLKFKPDLSSISTLVSALQF